MVTESSFNCSVKIDRNDPSHLRDVKLKILGLRLLLSLLIATVATKLVIMTRLGLGGKRSLMSALMALYLKNKLEERK